MRRRIIASLVVTLLFTAICTAVLAPVWLTATSQLTATHVMLGLIPLAAISTIIVVMTRFGLHLYDQIITLATTFLVFPLLLTLIMLVGFTDFPHMDSSELLGFIAMPFVYFLVVGMPCIIVASVTLAIVFWQKKRRQPRIVAPGASTHHAHS